VRAIELVTNSDQLAAFEFGHAQAAPAFGRADQCDIHELEHSALAKRMRNHLGGASPFLTEQPLKQVGRTNRTPVREREAQVRNACFEVILQARHDGRAAPEVAAMSSPQHGGERRGGGLIAGNGVRRDSGH